jgi:2,3-bisphosphoglycerate-dependent phosphoglycerate mutase
LEQRWPTTLWIVRHGQCATRGAARDLDVPLTALGEEQAAALGRWFAAMPAGQRPSVVLSSPHRRARQTADGIAEAEGLESADVEVVVDERLRERELGMLEGMSSTVVRERHPEQDALRQRQGDFYYRPPGGESWCDLVLRLRSALDTISLHHAGQRVLLVSHETDVLCVRYLLECLTDEEILSISRAHPIANCAVTSYVRDELAPARMALERFNFVAPLMDAGTLVTRRADLNMDRSPH